jgi:WD40 repeat protein
MDPIIRAYDLTTGTVKVFEGHRSWIFCMQAYTTFKEDGSIKNEWLFSASDDSTVRIWDIPQAKCL